MARGDHIRVRRFMYFHHGIDCGDGTVIHYTGTLWKHKEAAVERTPLQEFAKGKTIAILRHDNMGTPDEVIQRAESRLNEQKYHVVFNNCEHFATWCMIGEAKSSQVQVVAVTVVSATVAIIGGIVVVVARKSKTGLEA